MADDDPTLLLEVLEAELPDFTALEDLEEEFPDLTAPDDLEVELPDRTAPEDLEELFPERTAPLDLELELPDLTALDLFCELDDLLLTALGAEDLLDPLRLTADLEEEDLALVACDLFWLLLELFICLELLFDEERLATCALRLLVALASRDDLELCG